MVVHDAEALHVGLQLVKADDLVAVVMLLIEEAVCATLTAQLGGVVEDPRERLVLGVTFQIDLVIARSLDEVDRLVHAHGRLLDLGRCLWDQLGSLGLQLLELRLALRLGDTHDAVPSSLLPSDLERSVGPVGRSQGGLLDFRSLGSVGRARGDDDAEQRGRDLKLDGNGIREVLVVCQRHLVVLFVLPEQAQLCGLSEREELNALLLELGERAIQNQGETADVIGVCVHRLHTDCASIVVHKAHDLSTS